LASPLQVVKLNQQLSEILTSCILVSTSKKPLRQPENCAVREPAAGLWHSW